MECNFNHLLLDKDPSAKLLIQHLQDNQISLQLAGSLLYYSFPLYRDTADSTSRVNVLLLSKKHGLFIIECTPEKANQSTLLDSIDKLEQVNSQVFSKLIKSRLLRQKNTSLNFPMLQLIFAPNNQTIHSIESEVDMISSLQELDSLLNTSHVTEIATDKFNEVIAILEGSKILSKPSSRELPAVGVKPTKGHIFQNIEQALANFDFDQKRAAMNIVNGPQRIRGLAGSGKTIVLTWKAALIHLQDPDAEILYTFYTKSLYDLIRSLITRFYRHFSETDPNWDKIKVLHAWGGRSLPGVYYNACIQNGLRPKSVNDIPGRSKNKFDFICNELLTQNLNPKYDYSLIDEAQDFSPSFYRLCNKLTKQKRVIWGYDECQNILDVALQDTKKTFGYDKQGNPEIDLSGEQNSLNDIVLHRCYRNPKEILMYSFALGFGLHNDRILQMLENNEHWEDLGFKVDQGSSKEGDQMIISRPNENSPLTEKVDLIEKTQFKAHEFPKMSDECEYVAHRIIADLNDNLLPQDILVITLDDYHGKAYFSKIESILNGQNIKTHNHFDTPYTTTDFFRTDHVTLSSIYKAKGNEAASVYVVGIDQIFSRKDSINERNKIFTAFTRSKAWITVTGSGPDMRYFLDEVSKIEKDMPHFKFTMPNKDSLKTFQRDLSESTAALNQVEREIMEMAKKLGKTPDDIIKMLNFAGSKK